MKVFLKRLLYKLFIKFSVRGYCAMKNLALAIPMFISLLSGCVVVDVYEFAKDTTLDPTDTEVTVEEHDSHYSRNNNKTGSLYIFWSSTYAKPKQYMSGIYVYIDGKKAGAVKHNTYTVFELIPGDYKVAVGDSDGTDKEISVSIARGQDIYYRTGITSNLMMPNTLYLHEENNPAKAQKIILDSTYVTLKT